MSLTDAIRKKKNRPVNGADPAQAFGAEELTMEEIQRQTFVPPEKKGPGLAQRAGAALSSLRTRIVGEEPEEDAFADYAPRGQRPAEEAPVYSARSYQSESAPDLGWENPFAEPSPEKKSAPSPAAAEPRREYRSYTQAAYAPPEYAQSAYAPPAYTPPVFSAPPGYDAGYRAPAGYAPAYDPYQDGYPPEPEFYGNAYPNVPAPESWANEAYPQEPYGYPEAYGNPEPDGYPGAYPEEQGYYADNGSWYDPDNMPAPRRKARPKVDAGDFKYMFWSGGIVLGMFLTVFAFIYGCVV